MALRKGVFDDCNGHWYFAQIGVSNRDMLYDFIESVEPEDYGTSCDPAGLDWSAGYFLVYNEYHVTTESGEKFEKHIKRDDVKMEHWEPASNESLHREVWQRIYDWYDERECDRWGVLWSVKQQIVAEVAETFSNGIIPPHNCYACNEYDKDDDCGFMDDRPCPLSNPITGSSCYKYSDLDECIDEVIQSWDDEHICKNGRMERAKQLITEIGGIEWN